MKTVLIGITGGIAAYKVAQLVSNLSKNDDINVEVLMSKHACEFITPLTLQTLSHNRVTVDSFDTNYAYDVHHISQAKKADLFLIAPASADIIAKVAHGIADDALTTTFLACHCKKLIAPAMNTGMLENPITQDNLKTCQNYGMVIIDSTSGHLACGDTGKGRLAEVDTLMQAVLYHLYKDDRLQGKKVLINGGPTQEAIDPVRYISNHSTGKMGRSLAKAFAFAGADVTLVMGPNNLKPLYGVTTIDVVSAKDMAETMIEHAKDADILVCSAAVADYRPKTIADHKIKKRDGDMAIELERTQDILKTLGQTKKANQVLIGFAMETNDLEHYAMQKCNDKHCDFIVGNTIVNGESGFGSDTNRIIITNGQTIEGPWFGSKDDMAKIIVDKVVRSCY